MVSQIEQKRIDAADSLVDDIVELAEVIKAKLDRREWLDAWNYIDELVKKGEKARVTIAPLTMDGGRT